MARMYPRPLPAAVLADPRRAAERKVYAALDGTLNDSFRIFHGVSWLAKGRTDEARDGEVDFVVVHARRGILLIEVKGGRVERDGTTGRWTSTDRAGVRHAIDDPFAQVRGAKHALLGKLKQHPAWAGRWIEIGHAVAFPDGLPPQGPLGLDAPAEIVISSGDLDELGEKVLSICGHWRGRAARPFEPGDEGIEALTTLLAPSFEVRSPLGVAIAEDERAIVHLSEEQLRVLGYLRCLRRVLVTGGAGTGKTLLALEKAKRLAREGLRVLLTCFNKPLAAFLKESAGKVENLDVLTFHGLCYALARDAGIPLVEPGSQPVGPDYFETTMPAALLEALARTERRYDAILVDEGQDFHEGWWIPLQMCLAEPDTGILYVFHDARQRLRGEPVPLPEGLAEIPLTENHRNTQRIASVAGRFGRGEAPRAVGPEGRAVEPVALGAAEELEPALDRVLDRLVRHEDVAPADVAVLAGCSLERAGLGRNGRVGSFQVTRTLPFEPGRVVLETIHRFKGLERPVVVLAALEGMKPEEREPLLYSGLTRARSHLVVVGQRETLGGLGL